ncbi:MAG: PDDEXK nuclease domain-containing protein [bacterium]
MNETPGFSYVNILRDLKNKIQIARQQAAISVNSQLLSIYWEIGNTILKQQQQEGWGTKIIERLSTDLKKEFPEIKGFSVRNIKYMRSFAEAWPSFSIVQTPLAQLPDTILQQPSAKLASSQFVQPPVAQIQNTEKQDGIIVQAALAQISWYHHITLLEKIKDPAISEFYLQKTIQNGWSRDVMAAQIRSKLHLRIGNAITNFEITMPPLRSDLARETLKNPYLLDFIDLQEEIRERDLERGLLEHLKQFLLELGRGFAYVGNQFNLAVENDEFFLDLLFFNFHLNCFVVFELKVGEFQPEFAGKLNFYRKLI